MKKLCLLLFFSSCFSIVISSTNAWETKITIECINEKLEPCSASEISYIESNNNSDLILDTVIKKNEKIVVKKKITKEKKKEVEKKKDIFTKTTSSKSNVNSDFDRNISFEEFKVSVINYTNNSDYPDIDN